jgi:hypothetical protein
MKKGFVVLSLTVFVLFNLLFVANAVFGQDNVCASARFFP